MFSVRGLHYVIEQLRKHTANAIAITQLTIFLTVCYREGITMTELSECLNMPQGSVSRNVKVLSRYLVEGENGREVRGYDLIRTEPALDDRRRLAVYLTDKGRHLLDQIQTWLKEAERLGRF